MRTRRGGLFVVAALALALITGACTSLQISVRTAAPPLSGATPAASTTPAPSAMPLLRLEGSFATTPAHGPLGSTFTASASGMTPNTDYTLVWASADGSWQ